jgi:hypothetical protein
MEFLPAKPPALKKQYHNIGLTLSVSGGVLAGTDEPLMIVLGHPTG